MANNPLDKVYLDSAMLDAVAAGGEITSGSDTYTADEDTIYMIPEEIGDLVQTTGTSTSDVMSQKAVTDALANKVDKTTSASKVYATDSSGNQTTLSIGTASGNAAIYRDSGSGSSTPNGYLVSHDPSNDYQVATKHYTDGRVVANPSGTASTNLTKLQVGSTIYGISSGGGSLYRHNVTIMRDSSFILDWVLINSSSTAYTSSTVPSDLWSLGATLKGGTYIDNNVYYQPVAFARCEIFSGWQDVRMYCFESMTTDSRVQYFSIETYNNITVYDTVTAI